MGVSIISQNGKTVAYLNEYVVDTLQDLIDFEVPASTAPGSTALVLEDSSVFALGTDREWYKL